MLKPRRYYFRIMQVPDILMNANPVCVHLDVRDELQLLTSFERVVKDDFRWVYADFRAGLGIWMFWDMALGPKPDLQLQQEWNKKASFEVRQIVWSQTSASL